MSAKRKALIDCDPGHDDAVAILLAARHFDLLGITTVGGNQTLERVTVNALRVLELGGLTGIPVAAGADWPLLQALHDGGAVHGKSGLDGHDLPAPTSAPDPRHGVDFLIETALANPGVILFATGPLTNVAMALRKEPKLAAALSEISFMGGSAGRGNATAAAEFNAWTDPEAVAIVLESGVPLRMAGLNLTQQATYGDAERARLRGVGSRTGAVIADLLDFYRARSGERYGFDVAYIHDPVAVAATLDPSLVQAEPMHVTMELRGEHTRGMTVCDRRWEGGYAVAGVSPETNVAVGLTLDRDRFWDLLEETLATYP